ncbi:hypothetical protein H8356DRAFT_1351244 [Neocallimastix lanati (nom. inval.)]|nr:hypothetical protein H8356DRAFT_1351244 [Neocallimastix sp. JGI-2020a]
MVYIIKKISWESFEAIFITITHFCIFILYRFQAKFDIIAGNNDLNISHKDYLENIRMNTSIFNN